MKTAAPDQSLFGFAVPPHRRGPKRTKHSKVAHGSRPELKAGNVAHVTVKLKAGLPSLRRGKPLSVVLAAIGRVNEGEWIRIVHYSIQSNHLHLIVEASKSAHLSRGMTSLNTGLGMRLNRLWSRTGEGSVFKERFHMVVIDSPRQMRYALKYVLRNDVHHGLNLGPLDPCSSAPAFPGWQQRQNQKARAQTAQAAAVCPSTLPRTWLLRIGWQKTKSGKELLSTGSSPSLAPRSPSLQA